MSQALLAESLHESLHTAVESKPDWLGSRQKEALLAYEATPAPRSNDEAWRFGDCKALDFSDCVPARPVGADTAQQIQKRSAQLFSAENQMVFANDRLLHRELHTSAKPVFLPLSEALRSHGELIRDHLLKQPLATGSQKFAFLHLASLRNGTFLYLPKGCRVEEPLHVFHWLAGSAQTAFPNTLVIAEEDSSATLVDWFTSADETRHMSCAMSDLWVNRGASLKYASVQQWNRAASSLQSCNTHVSEGGHALSLGIHLGGAYSRFENTSRLLGKGARGEMYGLTVADGNQRFDQRTFQEHTSADTFSNLLFKNALYDTAKTTFSGLIRVDEEAHRTDAYQKVRNLLLSDQAEANSLPGLEILADEVRCSHGATTGEIDREELFYLQSRGITERTALGLITEGFLGEVLQKIENAALLDSFSSLLRTRLGAH